MESKVKSRDVKLDMMAVDLTAGLESGSVATDILKWWGGRLEKQRVGEKIWSLQFAREFGVNFPELFCTKLRSENLWNGEAVRH